MKLAEHPAVEKIRTEIDDETKAVLEEAEKKATTFSLADAIREGSAHTDQAYKWTNKDDVCALSAAALSITARGL